MMRWSELEWVERVADYSSAVLDLLAYFFLCSLVVLVVLFSVGVLTAAPPVEFVVVANKADPRQSPSSGKTQASTPPPSVPTTKLASGHTHTCSKGHTWDHTMDGGSHRCPFCGESNFVVSNRTHVTSLPTELPYRYSLSQSYGGCSGPGCATSSSTPSRAVGWRIFRR